MKKTTRHWLGHTVFVIAAMSLMAACAGEGVAGPGQRAVLPSRWADAHQAVDLTGCEQLAAPAGSQLAFRSYAEGVQIYRWSGTAWVFRRPEAKLFADAGGRGLIGTHYAGPTWESVSGSKVFGSLIAPCPRDPADIAWLLLGTTGSGQPGLFHGVTHIQRVNTVGGIAPTIPGSFVGQEKGVGYTAEYLFFRAP